MRVRVWIVVFLVVGVVGGTGLALWSIGRWKDALQESRTRSCQQTYQAFIEVFRPYFPESQPVRLREFKETVARLKAGCAKQTDP